MGPYCSISPSKSILGFDIVLDVDSNDVQGEMYVQAKDKRGAISMGLAYRL